MLGIEDAMRGDLPHDARRHIHDLLNDPIAQKVMNADKVDANALLAVLVRAASKLKQRYPELVRSSCVGPECASSQATHFRPGVGIMLVDSAGRVFVGKRIDVTEEAWQMPQGGIDGDEAPIAAAMRELSEELSTTNVEVVAESSRWHEYELPNPLRGRAWDGRWDGQRQRWFLMRFLGDDAEINIATEHPEFSAWRWVAPEQIIELIVLFKRRLYLDVLEEFAVSLSHMS